MNTNKIRAEKMSMRKLVQVIPQAFVNDERSSQGLAIFENQETKEKFTVFIESEVNVNLFLRESFKKSETGFSLSYEFIKAFNYEIDMAVLEKENESDIKVSIFLKHKDDTSRSLKEVRIKIYELLGLWNNLDFKIMASTDLISFSKDMSLPLSEGSGPQVKNLHKKYGQKYLI